MKNRDDFQHDGRVVADMSDIEGAGGFSLPKFRKNTVKSETSSDFSEEERRIYVKAALLSTLLIASVFLIGAALFILFCQHIWLK